MRWKAKPKSEWIPWFAWHPVQINHEWIWLERIERRIESYYGGELVGFSYRNTKTGE